MVHTCFNMILECACAKDTNLQTGLEVQSHAELFHGSMPVPGALPEML